MGLFSKKMTYKDLVIEAGAGGIDITRAGVKKHYTFDEFAALVYPSVVGAAVPKEAHDVR